MCPPFALMGHVESFSAFFLRPRAPSTALSAERELDASVCTARLRRLFCALVNLIGQSLSGHAVVSPPVWFADKQIVHYVQALPKKPKVRIWMDIGTKEGSTAEEAQQTVNGARLLPETLIKKGWKPGKDLNYFEAEGAEHNEGAWAARVEQILTFLFPRKM